MRCWFFSLWLIKVPSKFHWIWSQIINSSQFHIDLAVLRNHVSQKRKKKCYLSFWLLILFWQKQKCGIIFYTLWKCKIRHPLKPYETAKRADMVRVVSMLSPNASTDVEKCACVIFITVEHNSRSIETNFVPCCDSPTNLFCLNYVKQPALKYRE